MLRIALFAAAMLALAAGVAGAASNVNLVRLSTDPYTNSSSQHKTEVEPDSFAFGSTEVMAFQVGRFTDGGSSNVGFATSTDNGQTWTNGFLPGTTVYATPAGPYARVSDPSVAYDAKDKTWLIVTLGLDSGGGSLGPIVNRSLDGGLTWKNPVTVSTGSFPDKTWIVCDNKSTSPFYGHCYIEWDDAGTGGDVEMNTSTDGGKTWSAKKTSADDAFGLGGQPLVRPDGSVVVPFTADYSAIQFFNSTNGGASWGTTKTVASQSDHGVAGSLRVEPLPSAEIDKRGRIFVSWNDCRFRSGCSANDIVYAIIKPNNAVSAVKRVPIDPTGSGVDHFAPGFGVDPKTSGNTTHIGLTYYYLPVANCGSTCKVGIGYISSSDGGSTWTSPIDLATNMSPTWFPSTNQGRMFGDYISTSFVNGKAFPVIIVAKQPSGSTYDAAAYTTSTGLKVGAGTLSSAGDEAVQGAASDHARVTRPTAN